MARGVLVGVLIPGDRYGSRIGLVAYLLKTRVLCVCFFVFFNLLLFAHSGRFNV